MAREKGRQMRRERKEVKSVPTRNGNAPNSLDTGFHVLLKKKERPKALREGKECRSRLKNMATSKTTIAKAEKKSVFRKIGSARKPGTRGASAGVLFMDRFSIVRDRFDDLFRLLYCLRGERCIM